jgi:hypothetical protein
LPLRWELRIPSPIFGGNDSEEDEVWDRDTSLFTAGEFRGSGGREAAETSSEMFALDLTCLSKV